MSVASALLAAGPGKYSLDYVLKTVQRGRPVLPGLALAIGGIAIGGIAIGGIAIGGIAIGVRASKRAEQQEVLPSFPREESGAELRAGETAAHPV